MTRNNDWIRCGTIYRRVWGECPVLRLEVVDTLTGWQALAWADGSASSTSILIPPVVLLRGSDPYIAASAYTTALVVLNNARHRPDESSAEPFTLDTLRADIKRLNEGDEERGGWEELEAFRLELHEARGAAWVNVAPYDPTSLWSIPPTAVRSEDPRWGDPFIRRARLQSIAYEFMDWRFCTDNPVFRGDRRR